MPVLFDSEPSGCIKIGLINNMSDEALKATERQFVSLLDAASENWCSALMRGGGGPYC